MDEALSAFDYVSFLTTYQQTAIEMTKERNA